jgi:hypothetical protein
MDLKSVGLFLRAGLGVDAPDIRLRIGIGSSSHERLPNNYVKQRQNQRVALFLLSQLCFLRRGQAPTAPILFVFSHRH